MDPVSIGLAGIGYWGSRLARNINECDYGRLAAICDPDPTRLEAALHRYPRAYGTTNLDDLVSSEGLDAVVLATPAASHFDHAKAALEADKHVMVEKPLALSTAECDQLCALARERGRVLMVG